MQAHERLRNGFMVTAHEPDDVLEMDQRLMQRVALVASYTAVSSRMAMLGSGSMIGGTARSRVVGSIYHGHTNTSSRAQAVPDAVRGLLKMSQDEDKLAKKRGVGYWGSPQAAAAVRSPQSAVGSRQSAVGSRESGVWSLESGVWSLGTGDWGLGDYPTNSTCTRSGIRSFSNARSRSSWTAARPRGP
jgi:hypothetical protein